MKKWFFKSHLAKVLIFIFLLTTSVCFGQVNKKLLIREAEKQYNEALYLYNNGEIGIDSLTINKFKAAKALYQKADLVNFIYSDVLLKLGSCYQDMGNYMAAAKEYKHSLQVRNTLSIPPDTDLFDIYASLGDVYYKSDQTDSALYFYNVANLILSKIDQSKEQEHYRLYNAFGAIFYYAGNYKQSINYFEKALDVSKSLQEVNNEDLIYINSNMAAALSKIRRNAEAINKFKTVLKLGSKTNILRVIAPFVYHNLGRAYLESGKYDSALFYLKKVDVGSVDLKLKINLANSVADANAGLGQFEEALKKYNEAIQISNKLYSFKTVAVVKAHLNKGKVFEKTNKTNLALIEYQQALTVVHYSFSDLSLAANPDRITEVISPMFLFEALKAKAGGLKKLYFANKNIKNLKISLATYQVALQVCDYIRKSYDSDEAKLFFTNEIHPVYEEAIEAAYLLFETTGEIKYQEVAFTFSERSKSAVLSEIVKEMAFKQIPGIPTTLLKRERELKQRIGKITNSLAETRNDENLLKKQQRNYEIELAKIYKEFEKNTSYYQLKYDNNTLSLETIRNKVLGDNTIMIEYFVGQRKIYGFLISTNCFQSFSIPLSSSIIEAIEKLRSQLTAKDNGKKYSGDQYSYQLYQKILYPFEKQITDIDNLLIIPDGILTLIPFEALTKDKKSYLVNDYTFTYAYSALIKYNTDKEESKKASNSILALAPFAQTKNKGILLASKTEIEAIGGKIFIDREATKSKFINSANKYDVIHLATHAQANNSDPLSSYISFYPRKSDSLSSYKLYTHEIYNLTLNKVKMIVLNACETGSGKLEKGEGVISLARAFSYAGCSNIIMSLWKADDQATSLIATAFFKYLKEGYAKDEALKKAKLDYLENNNVDLRFKSPNYWAHLVFWGNNDAIYESKISYISLIFVATLLLLIIAIYTFQKKKTIQPLNLIS